MWMLGNLPWYVPSRRDDGYVRHSDSNFPVLNSP